MNILYCGDEGIGRGVLVSILSLVKNCTEPLSIYIMTIEYEGVKPFRKEMADFLDKLVKGKIDGLPEKFTKNVSSKSFVKLIDATEIFMKNLPKKNMGSYFTPCSMLRLYADKVPELSKLDRLLYLDYDVVARRDISEFYHTDLTGVEVAGVLDIYGRRWYHYHGLFKKENDGVWDARPADERYEWILKQDYMNSGVMLFNMPECIKTKMFEKTVEICGERWMMLADQAALNKAITRRKLMPRRYNEQEERPRENTVLHHFSNNFKFWPYFRVQKVKPFEVDKIHDVLKIYEYDDILEVYNKLKRQNEYI